MRGRDDVVSAWLAKAESDLASARMLLAGSGPYDTACFHCQQAVEKFLKAFLTSHGRPFPFTHDLDELAALCDAIHPNLAVRTTEIVSLTDYAVRLRYDNNFWPTLNEGRDAVRLTEWVRTRIREALGVP